MLFAVLGASGRIGGRIAAEALARGHAVTAVLREGSRMDRGDGQVTVVRADAFDPAAVAGAVAGADVVVNAVGHAASLDDQSFYVRAAQSVVTALRSLDPGSRPRLLVVGGFGSLEATPGTQFADAGGFPDHAAPEIVGQRDALTYYRGVDDVRWTYLSPPPGGIPPGVRTGSYRSAVDRAPSGEPRDSRISMEDFAVAVVDEAEHGRHPFACVSAAN
jgi:putative NADH-flavin reductase